MPELPEVETIKRGLEKKIVGLKITDIQILTSKTFLADPKLIIGKKVLAVFRRAKVLGIELENDLNILFHLKMSGQIILENREKGLGSRVMGGHPTKDMDGEFPNNSTRVIFSFSDRSKLYFNDQRKFGWIKVIKNDQLPMINDKLGPEPLEAEFSWQILKSQLQKRKNTPIKVALLDQEVVAGVGNIYAAEACFIAKVDPKKKVAELNDEAVKRLHKGVVDSLKLAIKHGGSSKTHYTDIEGGKGRFLEYAFVYGRAGLSCKVCRTIISKFTLGGRGTYYCSNCQS